MAGTRGLGLECSVALAASGHAVAVCGRRRGSVDDAVLRIGESGGPVAGLVADVADHRDLRRLFADVATEVGPIDVLVVNTGGPPSGSLLDLDDDAWLAAVDSVLMSAVRACRLVLPGMIERVFGRIVVIGSSSVRRPIAGLTLSNVLRPGLNGLVKDLAVTTAGHGVTVNMVAPGRIETERTQELDAAKASRTGVEPSEVRAASEATIPAGRYGTPGELASVVTFLASSEAGYVTGQTIVVDGGLTASLP